MAIDGGLYHLVVELRKKSSIKVGAAGTYSLPPAYYVYTGSAARNLAARVGRHFSKDKAVRWHIDHLTTHASARVLFCCVRRGEADECSANMGVLINADMVVSGFGNSDCSRCPSHLAGFFDLADAESALCGFERMAPVNGGRA